MEDAPEVENEENYEEYRTTAIHAVLSFVIAVGLLLAGVGVIIAFVATKPEPETNEERELLPTVRVEPIVPDSHAVEITTQGVVRSVREVSLAAEVPGRVLSIAPDFIQGGSLKEGDVLVEIDPSDYRAALARAESGLADARLALQQEQAQAEQARSDWAKLGRGEPSDLALRKPQIAAAEARIGSAEAEVELARRNLERTTIRAPFDARVRRAAVEAGAVVAKGTPVGELFSATDLEVRLPFPLHDYGFLTPDAGTEVALEAEIGGERHRWPAVLDRLEGEVERATLSGYGIAKVKPDGEGELPPVGLFVEASVPGRVLEDVVELPRAAVRGRNEVWVENEGRLQKRTVEILRSGREELVVRGDFATSDRLVLTRLSAPLVGMKVEVETGDE